MFKREFAKIGKNVFRKLSGSVDHYRIIEADAQKENKEMVDHDSDLSNKHKSTTSRETVIVSHTRLSKSQIMQFLLYHFYSVDERGVIRDVCEKDIANTLGYTMKTVRNNNIIFEQLGLLYYSRGSQGINIMLLDYPNYFDKDGYGYLEFSFSRFEELKQIEHVNTLRLELRQELVYDNFEAKRKYKKDQSPCKISMRDFKTFAPKYTHYKGMLKNIVSKGTSAFKTVVEGAYIYFDLEKGVENGRALKEKKKNEYTSLVQEHLKEKQCLEYVHKSDIEDFVQLAFEYSIEELLRGLDVLIEQEFILGELDPTQNFGGRIRTFIRQNASSEQVPAEFIA